MWCLSSDALTPHTCWRRNLRVGIEVLSCLKVAVCLLVTEEEPLSCEQHIIVNRIDSAIDVAPRTRGKVGHETRTYSYKLTFETRWFLPHTFYPYASCYNCTDYYAIQAIT